MGRVQGSTVPCCQSHPRRHRPTGHRVQAPCLAKLGGNDPALSTGCERARGLRAQGNPRLDCECARRRGCGRGRGRVCGCFHHGCECGCGRRGVCGLHRHYHDKWCGLHGLGTCGTFHSLQSPPVSACTSMVRQISLKSLPNLGPPATGNVTLKLTRSSTPGELRPSPHEGGATWNSDPALTSATPL